eukprot:23541_1
MTFMKNVVINSFELYCSADDRTCSEVIMIFPTNVTVNSYELSCGYPACAFIQLEAAKAVIGDLNLHCSYCLNMDINAKISKSANISCVGKDSCDSADINLTATAPNVNVNIECANVEISASGSVGACYQSYFYIYGYIDSNANKNNNLTLTTGRYDFYSGNIYGYDLCQVDINCDVPYSCQLATINVSTSNKMNLKCATDHACHSLKTTGVINIVNNSYELSCVGVSTCNSLSMSFPTNTIINAYNISCIGSSSCNSLQLMLPMNQAINFYQLSCVGSSSCNSIAMIFPTNVLMNSYKLLCEGSSSCSSLTTTFPGNATINSYLLLCGAVACPSIRLNAANTIINDLNMHCTYCYNMDIIAKINNSANINCIAADSCDSANVNLVATAIDVKVNIECVNMDTSTSYSTGACYNSYFYIYGYVNSNRAKRNNLTLITGQYDFHSGHMYVYDLYETDINCQAPYSCGAATINTSSSQKMSLHCTNYAACDSLTTTLPMNKENNSSQLSCIGSYSCNSLKILFPSKRVFNSYQLSCNGSFSCNSITMRFPSNSIITLYQLSCNGPSSCGSLTTIFPENSIINSYQLSCGESACPSIRLNAATAIINELSMECIYCYNMDIDAKINNYANVNCIGTNSCESANVNLLSTSTDATVNIDCVNVEVSTMDLTGACLNSYWYIYGYLSNGDKNNNLTFINGQYDLYNGHIYGYNLYTTTIYCNTPYSCANAVINTKSSKTLDLRCKDDYSCYGATVYCPQGQVEKNCVIQCTKTTISTAKNCAEMMINASFSSNLTLFSGGTDMTVYIPQNDNGHPRFSIIEGYHFYGTTDPGMFLYAVNGFDDINFINYNGYKYGGDWAHMICGTEKCKISSTQWECSDPLSICNGNISSSSYPLCLTYNVTFKAMSHIDDNSSLINIDWNGLFATKPYIVYIGKYLYGSTIRCRDIPQPNECYIKCMTEQSCLDVYINPIASLSLLSIICEEKK